jgi:hypothetical protein
MAFLDCETNFYGTHTHIQTVTRIAILIRAVRHSAVSWAELIPHLNRSDFSGQPGAAAIVARLPSFEGLIRTLEAANQHWPGAQTAVERSQARLSALEAKGWLLPAFDERRRLEAALTNVPDAAPNWLDTFAERLRCNLAGPWAC